MIFSRTRESEDFRKPLLFPPHTWQKPGMKELLFFQGWEQQDIFLQSAWSALVFISKPGNLHIGRDGTTDSGDKSFWGAHGSLLLPTWREGMWNRILLSLFEDSSCIAILSPVPWSHLNPPNYIIYNHPELGWDNIVPLQWRIVAAKQRTWIWWQNWARNSGDPEVKLRVLLSSGISVVDRSLQMEPA